MDERGSTRDDPIVLDDGGGGGSDGDGDEAGVVAAASVASLEKSDGGAAGSKIGGDGDGSSADGGAHPAVRGLICADGGDYRPSLDRRGGQDGDSPSDGKRPSRKRPRPTVAAAAAASPSSVGARGGGGGGGPPPPIDPDPPPPLAPFRLFATLRDESDGRAARLARHCHTLREMLGLDGPDAEALGPMRFVVVANYMIDFEFLLDYAPELLSAERALVFYGVSAGDGGGPEPWRAAAGGSADFVRLIPSDPAGSETNPLPFRTPYGVHHSKLFLIGFDGRLRVIVHTANLLHCGVRLNANGAYVQDFPLKSTHAASASASATSDGLAEDESYLLSCPFEESLASYLETYRHDRRRTWPAAGSTVRTPQTLVEVVRRYDYNSSYAVLIPSVPGRYGTGSCPWGYLKLRKAVREYASIPDDDGGGSGGGSGGDRSRAENDTGPIICQFSSMGSLTHKWLHEFASAVDIRACRSSPPKFSGPSSSSRPTDMTRKLRLIWPTSEEIRNSAQGYRGGDAVPGTAKNVSKDFLRPMYRRWSSASDPSRKGGCIPHIKTYLQPSSSDGESVEWMVLTSHNLSRAAWGEVQNGAFGQRLFLRHWELGVFFSPRLLEEAAAARGGAGAAGGGDAPRRARMAPFGARGRGVAASSGGGRRRPGSGDDDVVVASLPLPYDALRPVPYGPRDEPWAVDRRYDGRPDMFGRCSCYDP